MTGVQTCALPISLKRFFDPANKSPNFSSFNEEGILGMEALRKKAEAGAKFDYDSEVEGLRALDRYTVQIRLNEPRPRFINTLADPTYGGVVAREEAKLMLNSCVHCGQLLKKILW